MAITTKPLALLMAAVLSLAASSCSDKKSDEPSATKKPITNGVTYEFNNMLAESTSETNTLLNYKVVTTTDGKTLDVYHTQLKGETLPITPNALGISTSTVANGIYYFNNKSTKSDSEEYAQGYIDPVNGTCWLQSTVGSYSCVATSRKILSALGDKSVSYQNTTERYYEIDVDETGTKADVYIYNIAFVSQMPKLSKICIPGVAVKRENFLLTLTADKVTPLSYEGGVGTPMTSREVTNLEIQIYWNEPTKSTVKFTCFNLDFTDNFYTQYTAMTE